MTRTVLGLASFTFLAFWGTSSNLSKSGDTKRAGDLAAVKAVSKGIIAADNSGDIGAVSDLYEDEAVWLPPSGPMVEGKAVILARYKTSFDQLKLEYSEQSVETQIGVIGRLTVALSVARPSRGTVLRLKGHSIST
jgi:ketosteroid isomerase-like protein